MIASSVINSTDARREWSSVVDSVLREKPKFIKRTRDYMFLSDLPILESLLQAYELSAVRLLEDDGSVTLSLDQLDLIENAPTEQDALNCLASAILEYAEEYYSDFAYWSRGDRKSHIPYVLKALILNDTQKIGGLIECRHGGI